MSIQVPRSFTGRMACTIVYVAEATDVPKMPATTTHVLEVVLKSPVVGKSVVGYLQPINEHMGVRV
jgi:hypothetical protein